MDNEQQEFQKAQEALNRIRKQNAVPKENRKNVSIVENIPLQENAKDAVQRHEEDIARHRMEEEYIAAVKKDFKSRKKVRGKFLNFYIWFMSIVTALIFFVIIDPIGLVKGQSIYGDDLKLALVGVFFANLISIALIMVKYSFAPIDNILKAFERLNKF